jgi:tRNA 2-thiouridine synthesizing protein A
MDDVMADQFLDLKGLNCPLPVMKTKKALASVPVGQTLEVLATDPGAVEDFKAFCETTGNRLLESTQNGDTFRFLIKRA